MEGIKKNSSSEEKIFKTEKTDVGIPVNDSPESTSLQTPHPPGQPTTRITELRALLLSLEYPQHLWPGEALKAVVQRFVRMPRTGWRSFKKIYIEKFKVDVSIDELKSQAEPLISSQAGRKCSRARFITESSKRFKPIEELLEENTLREAKVRTKVKEILRKELSSLKLKEVTEAERTRKVSSEKLDSEILEIIDQEINETLNDNPPLLGKTWHMFTRQYNFVIKE